MLSAFASMALYILLLGVAALLEQPIARGLDAFHLDALLRVGAAAVALVALLISLHGLSLPGWEPALAGVGIGLISGTGSLCYCVALNRLPSDLAACLANGYLVVTIVLGIVVLHEPLTAFTLAGLALTIGGAIVLSMRSGDKSAAGRGASAGGSRFALVAPPALPSSFPPSASSSASPSASPAPSTSLTSSAPDSASSPVPMPSPSSVDTGTSSSGQLLGLAWLGANVVLVGVGAFLEKPALEQLAPLQLNALAAFGMMCVGLIAVSVARLDRRGRRASVSGSRRMRLPAVGIGLMIGAGSVFYYLALVHLPVSIAAALANTYVLVTVVLAVPVFHQRVTWHKAGGVLAMLVGVVLLTLRLPL